MTTPSPDLFLRQWKLSVTAPTGGETRSWDNLRVTFNVEKTLSSSLNKAEITIYNLSQGSRDFVERKGSGVVLEAGYMSTRKLIYSGQVQLASHDHKEADWATKLTCEDGVRARRALVHKSFKPGITERAVIEAVAALLGVTVGKLDIPDDVRFQQGRQLSGLATRELDTLCRTQGLRWSIQDGVLQIVAAGFDTGEGAVVLTPETGLIGSPEKTEKKGYVITSLLQGGINPGRRVKVESREVKGEFVAQKVTHEGDSHGEPWFSKIETAAAKSSGSPKGRRARRKV